MIIFDGEGMIVCMNNLSNASREEINLWRSFMMSADKLPRGSRKTRKGEISFD
jgi:hypothetical protein